MPAPDIDDAVRRRMAVFLVVVAVVVVAYWAAWYGHRGLVASETRHSYYDFENAFPLADGWLVVALAASAWFLVRKRAGALGWLLAGGGAGLYLFGMDVLYDAEHGIWTKGGGGAIEAAINVATLAISLGLLRWSWRRRVALLAGAAGAAGASAPGT
ncbi:MAG: hypothetical protein ACYDA2_05235 [Acidimicrobiales bacterium]